MWTSLDVAHSVVDDVANVIAFWPAHRFRRSSSLDVRLDPRLQVCAGRLIDFHGATPCRRTLDHPHDDRPAVGRAIVTTTTAAFGLPRVRARLLVTRASADVRFVGFDIP